MISILERLKQETPLFVIILIFMSIWNFVLSRVEHEKSFITCINTDGISERIF